MKRAFFLTAYNRPGYLKSTLDSWLTVRGKERWDFFFRLEPCSKTEEILDLIKDFQASSPEVRSTIIVNEAKLGVLHHPWVGFEELFREYDFVVRAEDDILVSSDVLEYMEWGSTTFLDNQNVLAVTSHNEGPREPQKDALIFVTESFNPLIWGTWKDRWIDVIRDTWDHDYSTFNGTPGNEAGWDWNLNTRIIPQRGLTCCLPLQSRVSHIGIVGTHGCIENFKQTPSFIADREPIAYEVWNEE